MMISNLYPKHMRPYFIHENQWEYDKNKSHNLEVKFHNFGEHLTNMGFCHFGKIGFEDLAINPKEIQIFKSGPCAT